MSFDWKQAIGTVAPVLAGVLGGPLAGGAVKVLADTMLGGTTGDPVADEAKIAGMLAGGMTPEMRAAIIQAETTIKLEMIKASVREKEIEADLDKATLQDVQHARQTHGADKDVLTLGIAVLILWGVLTAATLWGLYEVLIGGIKIVDVGIVATVFTVLGSTVGYVSNSAQQVLSYYFGSSRGSTHKTDIMATAISGVGKR